MRLSSIKSPQLQAGKILLLTCGLISLSIGFLPSFAQANQPSQIQFIPANTDDPPDRGTPSSTEGTGSRSGCMLKENKPPLTPLVGRKTLNLTVNQSPTIWIYVPYTPQESSKGEFSLQDGDKDVYRTNFQLPATPGIVSISLPSTVSPLAVGKKYRWYFDINCPRSEGSGEAPAFTTLTGLVEIVNPPSALNKDLQAAATPLEKIATYAKYGIWYETVTELAKLQLQSPQNAMIKRLWVELLSAKTVGLANIAQEPIAGEVKIQDRR